MPVGQEANKAVATVTKAFAGNPSCLAAILLSGTFAVLIYFSLRAERIEMHERQLVVLERCLPLPHPEQDQ